MNPILLNLIIQETPTVVAAIKARFAKTHPDQPQPTSDEVMAGFESAFESSRAKDEAWKAAHPE